MPASKPTSGLALTSMILGIAGMLLFFMFIPSVLAVIFGAIGLSATWNSARKGRGFAIAGLILGMLGIAGGFFFWAAIWTSVDWYYQWDISAKRWLPLGQLGA